MNNIANIIIDILILIFVSIGIITSSTILFLIIYYRHQSPFNISILLVCNNSLSVILCCIFLLDMYACSLYGDIHMNISFNNWWCCARAYFLGVTLALVYHSYLIQACYRLFRIVFYKHRQLQKFQTIFILILIQWLIDFLLFIPCLLLHYFEYIIQDYYCHILFSNFRGILINGTIVFFLPMISIGIIYFYIVRYMKQERNLTINHENYRHRNQRDFIVLRRIIILVGVLFIIPFPACIIYLWYIFSGYLYPLIYRLD